MNIISLLTYGELELVRGSLGVTAYNNHQILFQIFVCLPFTEHSFPGVWLVRPPRVKWAAAVLLAADSSPEIDWLLHQTHLNESTTFIATEL